MVLCVDDVSRQFLCHSLVKKDLVRPVTSRGRPLGLHKCEGQHEGSVAQRTLTLSNYVLIFCKAMRAPPAPPQCCAAS